MREHRPFPLRLSAVLVVLVTMVIVVLLPGSTGCPPRQPGEFDPLECEPSAISPPRFIALIVGIAIAVVLLVVAFVRDTEDPRQR